MTRSSSAPPRQHAIEHEQVCDQLHRVCPIDRRRRLPGDLDGELHSGGGHFASGSIYSSTATADGKPRLGRQRLDVQITVAYTVYGDANLDGAVNGADLGAVLANFGSTSGTWYMGDFNYDGSVNGADLGVVLANFGQHVSVTAAVPEPSTLLLSAAGLVSLLAYAWRKRK